MTYYFPYTARSEIEIFYTDIKKPDISRAKRPQFFGRRCGQGNVVRI